MIYLSKILYYPLFTRQLISVVFILLSDCLVSTVLAKPVEVNKPKRHLTSRPRPVLPPLKVVGSKNSSMPGNRQAAATRSLCGANPPLTALVPEGKVSLTAQANPTLWFFIPSSMAHPLRLEISDLQDHLIGREVYPFDGHPGIVGLKLSTALQPNKEYKWRMVFVCQEDSSDPSVSGRLKRIYKSASTASEQTSHWHAGHPVLWLDVVTSAGNGRRNQPENQENNTDWVALLHSVGLKSLAHLPLTSCCSK